MQGTSFVAAALRRRRIDICALQETRWNGQKACDVEQDQREHGYKLIYFGSPRTRNGVGIAISERIRNAVRSVYRYDDRLMKIVIVTSHQTIHAFTAYAQKTGRSESEKDAFWQLLDNQMQDVLATDYIVVVGDINGHVGETADGSRCHRGRGFGRQW
ncbi:craniofacial development protein 2-like [Centruroides vittatus]|uniref:craniofacial development protein 2-like n=1 Tax=Centruroides vittatus TaxID=120091 RepID=UPI003510770D